MKEKKLGRGFKVGDKVKLTKAGEESGAFASGFREGDVAEVLLLNSFDDFISSVKVITGKAVGYLQYCDANTDTRAWFEHDKKTHKKQRKYFRMGDFVALKDCVSTNEVTEFCDIVHSNVGVVCGIGDSGYLEVHFGESINEFDLVRPDALRLATKEERKTLRKLKVAKITYDNVSEIEQDTEVAEEKVKIPPEYDVKVGDIVEVTLDVNGHPLGTIGEVVLVQEDSGDYYNSVKVRDNKGILWNELDVKLVY